MGFWSSVGNVFSSAVDTVCDTVSKVSNAVASVAKQIAPVIVPLITSSNPVVAMVCRVACALLVGLAIFKPDEKIEDLGDRAMQAAEKGITPDKFENFDEYMDALRNFDIDPVVSANTSDVTKVIAGLGVATLAVEDKFNAERGSLSGIWLLPMVNPTYFTPERMQSLLSTGSLKGDILSYLDKNLSGGDSHAFEKRIAVDLDGTPLSGDKLDDLYDALDGAREKWAELAKQVEAKQSPDSAV